MPKVNPVNPRNADGNDTFGFTIAEEDRMGNSYMKIDTMSRVYIASPYRTNEIHQRHTFDNYLEECIRDSLARKEAPYAPHYYLPDFLQDSIPELRQIGMRIGQRFLMVCNCVAVYKDFGISDGMQEEIDFAKAHKIPVSIRTIL